LKAKNTPASLRSRSSALRVRKGTTLAPLGTNARNTENRKPKTHLALALLPFCPFRFPHFPFCHFGIHFVFAILHFPNTFQIS
jgi:hypothetical protein